jgi:hypothetical protein
VTALTAAPVTIIKRRLAAVALIAAAVAAVLAPATSARQTLVHAFMAKDGSTIVSGYDGGVTLARPTP